MKIRRIVPPAAAPLSLVDIWNGLVGTFAGERALRRLESEIKAYFGVRYVFFVSSGKAALTLILLGLKSLSPKREAVIPAYTCFSVPSAVCKAGLRVVPCDIDPSTLNVSADRLEDALTDDTLCVVAQHLFGIPSEIDELRARCESRGIFLVEDAAQAMGGSRHGRKLGTLADVGFFSLGRGKQVTCGSGGIIVTNSSRIAEAIAGYYAALPTPGVWTGVKELFELALLATFIHPILYWVPSGLPLLRLGQTLFVEEFPVTRLSRTRAGVLRRWRRCLAGASEGRATAAADLVQRLGLTRRAIDAIPYLRVPLLVETRAQRDRIYSLSHERGLGISLMYPTPVTGIPQLGLSLGGPLFPSATSIAERLLTVPNHHLVSERDRRRLCDLLRSAMASRLEDVPGTPSVQCAPLVASQP
jgi:dTDP-4-amino-4,6-dideoxygalactose transaminase